MRSLSFLFVLLICCEAKYVPKDGIYSVAETMPTYEKGMDAFNSFVETEVEKWSPEESGSIYVSFIVKTDGKLSDMKIVKGFSQEYDKRVMKILQNSSGEWTAGTEEGKAVDVKVVYPVRF